jgi:ketosteroid isomerase-like protein
MSQENVELARRTWALWSKGADDEVARRLAPDIEWHHQIGLGTPMKGIYRGREEVLGLSTAIRDSFGVARVEIEDVRESPPPKSSFSGAFTLKAEAAVRP